MYTLIEYFMDKTTNLDILVVYSSSLATSASVSDSESKHPFHLDSRQANYNESYSYFLDVCKSFDLNAGLTTSSDVIGPGTCDNYWTATDGQWSKINNRAKSTQIFDKISPTSDVRTDERSLLLSSENIQPFNDPYLHALFFDKLKTYKDLPTYAIPTVGVRSGSLKDITQSIEKLAKLIAKHPSSVDFGSTLILKDRFGAGGNHVYLISDRFDSSISKLMKNNPDIQFVLQPFLQFDKGFAYQKNQTATDIRIIIHNGKILQSYLRMAKADDFRCNEHQGGELVYVTEKDFPESVHLAASNIIKRINRPSSLYALDFAVSNSGTVYLMEGNIGPGLDWDATKATNTRMGKQLITSIVSELAERVSTQRS